MLHQISMKVEIAFSVKYLLSEISEICKVSVICSKKNSDFHSGKRRFAEIFFFKTKHMALDGTCKAPE